MGGGSPREPGERAEKAMGGRSVRAPGEEEPGGLGKRTVGENFPGKEWPRTFRAAVSDIPLKFTLLCCDTNMQPMTHADLQYFYLNSKG